MLYLAYLACIILICVNAEHIVRCNNETNPKSTNSVTLVPSPDHVGGRYVMEWCTKGDKNITNWELYIYYNTTKKPDQCRHYNFTYDKTFKPHSHVEENMNIDLNCSNVCFSTLIDLIFESCYHIKNQLHKQKHKMQSYDQLIYITNNFTNVTILQYSIPVAKSSNSEDYVTVQWFMGPVPAARYEMKLSEQGGAGEPWDVTENCTSAVHTVTCRLRVPPGAYTLVFELKEPWMYGSVAVDTASKDFNRTVTDVGVGVGAGSWGAAWWGAGGALALCVPGALLLHRARRSSSPRRKHAASEAEEVGTGVGAEGGEAAGGVRVLLLYARDCPLLVAAARRLAALLQHVARDGVGVRPVHAGGERGGCARAGRVGAGGDGSRGGARGAAADAGGRLPVRGAAHRARVHARTGAAAAGRARSCAAAALRRPAAAAGAEADVRVCARATSPLQEVLHRGDLRPGGERGAAGDAAAPLPAARRRPPAAARPGVLRTSRTSTTPTTPSTAAAVRARGGGAAAVRARQPRLPQRGAHLPVSSIVQRMRGEVHRADSICSGANFTNVI